MQQAFGFGTGAHLAADALEQGDAELLFELANLVADGAVGNAQLGGGTAEVAMAGGAFESAQGSQGRQAAHCFSCQGLGGCFAALSRHKAAPTGIRARL